MTLQYRRLLQSFNGGRHSPISSKRFRHVLLTECVCNVSSYRRRDTEKLCRLLVSNTCRVNISPSERNMWMEFVSGLNMLHGSNAALQVSVNVPMVTYGFPYIISATNTLPRDRN